ncbi:hypothetical protein QFC20_002838 [Naganishia adeliensis]|uniref:Uncharacterized protein n=1 Tax=Naganishia adeliensis TaxID=92952 RepID=A0ACC2WGL4_9TREE|nr:hypothetical protein QFC20_002838 [Naganishia adeliensis]
MLPRIVRTSQSTFRRGYATSPPMPDRVRNTLLYQAGVGFAAACGVVVYSNWRAQNGDSSVHCDSAKPSHLASPTDDPLIFNRTVKDTEAETFTRQAGDTVKKTLGAVKDTVEHLVGADAHEPSRVKEYDDPRIRMATWVMALQDHIVNGLEQLESSVPANEYNSSPQAPTFHRDHWLRPQGGEGSSCVLANGRVFEKAGVNVSVVHGVLPPAAVRQMKADHKSLVTDGDASLPFFAAGISIVLHPWNPHAPTVHLNYRYFEVDPPSTPQDALDTASSGATTTREPLAWWFGGGSDLTPSYLYPEDATHFHNTLKRSADAHDDRYFPVWKKWCDKYFYIPHRGEARGVGGIFFDDLTAGTHPRPQKTTQPTADDIFHLVQSMSASFLDSYLPIMHRRINMPFTEEERRWQLMRRGRYVEFNLVHDRGTKFGLFTPGARIETLPQTARWEYMSDMGAPGSGTREEELMKVLKTPVDWADV